VSARALLLRLALALAAVCLVLGAAEVTLRLLGVGQVMTYQADPRYGYLMRPSQRVSTWGEVIEINSLGLRGPELQDPKPPGALRLLFAGDSVTYGGGYIPEPQLFVRVVESLAAQDGLRVESVNVSAPGWSPGNWAAWLRAHGTLDADLIVPVLPAIDLRRHFSTAEQVGLVEQAPLLRLTTLWLKIRSRSIPGLSQTEENLQANLASLLELEEHFSDTPFQAVFIETRSGDTTVQSSDWAPYEALFPGAIDLRHVLTAPDYNDAVHLSAVGHAHVGAKVYAQLVSRLRKLRSARTTR
jgi:lysophospholipase L1-like esterase